MDVGGSPRDTTLNPLWTNVVLALHGDGANGATTIVDEKGRASPTSNRGTSVISTVQSKFGGASIAFNHDGGLIYQSGSAAADFQFGVGDFMFRGWVWLSSATAAGTNRVIFDTRSSGGDGTGFIYFIGTGNTLQMYSGSAYAYQGPSAFPTDQWVHVAVSRASGTLRLYQNGVMLQSSSFGANLVSGRCSVGEVNPEYQGTTAFQGYIDDFELVKGEAFYTATSYTLPTAPFPNS